MQSSVIRRPKSAEYKLFGVVYHHGQNATGGHYTCDVLVEDEKWLRLDDTALSWVDEEQVICSKMEGADAWWEQANGDAYLLFYCRL